MVPTLHSPSSTKKSFYYRPPVATLLPDTIIQLPLPSYCVLVCPSSLFIFFFFNDTAPTEIYPLPLHASLPIWVFSSWGRFVFTPPASVHGGLTIRSPVEARGPPDACGATENSSRRHFPAGLLAVTAPATSRPRRSGGARRLTP